MSVYYKDDEYSRSVEMPHTCFTCGRKLEFPYFFWLGADDVRVSLHLKCAENFAKALLKDCGRAEERLRI